MTNSIKAQIRVNLSLLNESQQQELLEKIQNMTIKAGTIKYSAGKTFPNKFKPGETQQSLLAVMEDGTEERIYFKTGRSPHADLQVGDSINILYETNREGKQIRKLYASTDNNSGSVVSNDSSGAAQNGGFQPKAAAPAAKPRMSVKDKVDMLASAYAYVFGVVHEKFDAEGYPGITTEDIRTMTAGIMIKLDRDNDNITELMTYPSGEAVDTVIEPEIVDDDDDNPVF